MTRFTVSRAWRPQEGLHYTGTIEIHMRDDFERDDAQMWGLVNAKELRRSTTIDHLVLVGAPEWHQRFNDLHRNGVSWEKALGGLGGATALSGLHVRNSRLKVKRIEARGLPGCGVRVEGASSYVSIESGLMERVGWPVMVTPDVQAGVTATALRTRDHWWQDAWDAKVGQMKPVSLRRLAGKGISARGESALRGVNTWLKDYMQTGDGHGWKGGGPGFTVWGGQSAHGYLFGVDQAFAESQGTRETHPQLWSAEDSVVNEHLFAGVGAVHRLCLFVAYKFIDAAGKPAPAHVNRSTFVCRTPAGQGGAAQVHSGAHVIFDDCDIIGREDAQQFVELEAGSTAEFTPSCRFYKD